MVLEGGSIQESVVSGQLKCSANFSVVAIGGLDADC